MFFWSVLSVKSRKPCAIAVNLRYFLLQTNALPETTAIKGMRWGSAPAPGTVKHIVSKGFSGPNGCCVPPGKKNKCEPP